MGVALGYATPMGNLSGPRGGVDIVLLVSHGDFIGRVGRKSDSAFNFNVTDRWLALN